MSSAGQLGAPACSSERRRKADPRQALPDRATRRVLVEQAIVIEFCCCSTHWVAEPGQCLSGACDSADEMKNWAGNLTYSTDCVLAPRSIAEAQSMVAQAELLRPLGTRHSFSSVADTSGVLLSTEHLKQIVEVGTRTVVVEAGISYGDLGSVLDRHGLAVPNYASLPHISVGGAIATATHGSGVRNQSLGASVA